MQEVISGLRNPVAAVHANDGSHRLFVGEQRGVVQVLDKSSKLLSTPFVDLQSIIMTSNRQGDERGFLGMAFHPKHANNGFVFFHLNVGVGSNGEAGLFNQVLRYRVMKDDPNQVWF